MYYFAIEFSIEMLYPLAPPQGWEGSLIFENLADSNRQSAISQTTFHRRGRRCHTILVKPTPFWDDLG
jgi:hypothetical protein